MQITTLEDLFAHPSFLFILACIVIVIGNIIIGVSIFPKDRRKKGYIFHRWIYRLVILAYVLFLIANHFLIENSFLTWFVLIYFLTVVPLSRKFNITAHAILASIGLVLLVVVATFSVL